MRKIGNARKDGVAKCVQKQPRKDKIKYNVFYEENFLELNYIG